MTASEKYTSGRNLEYAFLKFINDTFVAQAYFKPSKFKRLGVSSRIQFYTEKNLNKPLPYGCKKQQGLFTCSQPFLCEERNEYGSTPFYGDVRTDFKDAHYWEFKFQDSQGTAQEKLGKQILIIDNLQKGCHYHIVIQFNEKTTNKVMLGGFLNLMRKSAAANNVNLYIHKSLDEAKTWVLHNIPI